jgi:prolyl oligopeptidase
MNRHSTLLLLAALALAACGNEPSTPTRIDYPATAASDHTDTYHGTVVADPYRWLEDDVRESEAVKDWVERQNEVTFAYLETIEERDTIRARLEELWNFERYGLPYKEGGRYFYSHNDGLQNQNVIYMQPRLDDEPELLVDPTGA